VRSDEGLDPGVRKARQWAGPALREWNKARRGDIGVSLSGLERNHLFLNDSGRDFADISGISGLDTEADSRGFVLFDYDRDGWQDIALVNTNAPLLQLYRNQIGEVGGRGAAVALRFVGGNDTARPAPGLSNRDGVGAAVRVRLGDQTLVREVRAGEGFAAQNSATLLIGIGERGAADAVRVRWPGGREQEVEGVAAVTLLTFYEDPDDGPDGVAVARSDYARPPGRSPEPPPREGAVQLALRAGAPVDGEVPPTLALYTTMATWCPACKRNIPQVAAVREGFGADELAVYGVPIDPEDTPEMLAEYAAEYRPAYELLIDAPRAEVERVQAIVMREFARDVLPASFVTDADGRVLRLVAGVPTLSELRRLLNGRARDWTR